ncbi:MAG: hypothetical protein AB1352_04250 [Patescibacteria group bacterium]
MKKQTSSISKPTFPYNSFRLSREMKVVLPPTRQVVELMHHHWGIVFLAAVLIINYSSVSMLTTIPVFATTSEDTTVWIRSDTSQVLGAKYKKEAPEILSRYVVSRGQFAAKLSSQNMVSADIDAWLSEIQYEKALLLTLRVPAQLKEVHLGLVTAMGMDEQTAQRYLIALAGDRTVMKKAEDEFRTAEERLTMVYKLAPWLSR